MEITESVTKECKCSALLSREELHDALREYMAQHHDRDLPKEIKLGTWNLYDNPSNDEKMPSYYATIKWADPL